MINPFIRGDSPESNNDATSEHDVQKPNDLRRLILQTAAFSPFIDPRKVAEQLASSETAEGLSSIHGLSRIGIVGEDGSVVTENEAMLDAAELSAIIPNPYELVYTEGDILWSYAPGNDPHNLGIVFSMEGPNALDPSRQNTQEDAEAVVAEILEPLLNSLDDALTTWPPNFGNEPFAIYFNRQTDKPNIQATTTVHPDYNYDYNQWACGTSESGPKLESFIVVNAANTIYNGLLSQRDMPRLLEQGNKVLKHELAHVYMYQEGVNQRDVYHSQREQLANSLPYLIDRKYSEIYHGPHVEFFAKYRIFLDKVESSDWNGEWVDEHTSEFWPLITHAFELAKNQREDLTWDLFFSQNSYNLNQYIPCTLPANGSYEDYALIALERTLRDFGVTQDIVLDIFDLEVHTFARMMQEAIFNKENIGENDIYGIYGLKLLKYMQNQKLTLGANEIQTTVTEPEFNTKSDVDTVRIVLPESGETTLSAIDSDKIHQYYVITETEVIFLNPDEDVDLDQFAVEEENGEKVVYLIAGRISGYQEDITLNITVEEKQTSQVPSSSLVMPVYIEQISPAEFARRFSSSVTGASARQKTQLEPRRQFPKPQSDQTLVPLGT